MPNRFALGTKVPNRFALGTKVPNRFALGTRDLTFDLQTSKPLVATALEIKSRWLPGITR